MGQFRTKKKDQEDQDEKLATPWAEMVGHGNVVLTLEIVKVTE